MVLSSSEKELSKSERVESEERSKKLEGRAQERGGGRLAMAHSALLEATGSIVAVTYSLCRTLRSTLSFFQPFPPRPRLPSPDTLFCLLTAPESAVIACGGRAELPRSPHGALSSRERDECVFSLTFPLLSPFTRSFTYTSTRLDAALPCGYSHDLPALDEPGAAAQLSSLSLSLFSSFFSSNLFSTFSYAGPSSYPRKPPPSRMFHSENDTISAPVRLFPTSKQSRKEERKWQGGESMSCVDERRTALTGQTRHVEQRAREAGMKGMGWS
jgi:hypothetical protein